MARPTVVFPQPDSPTRPIVSPLRSVNDTPSTARTSLFFRGMMPPKTGKRTFRSCTSRMTSEVSMAVVVKVAADPMIGRGFDQRWFDAGAGLEPLGATRGELAADRKVVDVGNRARNRRQPFRPRPVHPRQRSEQSSCVWMQRVVEQLADGRHLLDLAAVHDGDAVARFGDD